MWESGTVTANGITFCFAIKRFDEGSEYGIDGGRISKLAIRLHGALVVNYDRGWDKRPETQEARDACEEIVRRYNWAA